MIVVIATFKFIISTNIEKNLRKQHANWAEGHKAHINTWAAELKNLTRDLDAAYAQKKRASARPKSDKKRQSKIDSADAAIVGAAVVRRDARVCCAAVFCC